MFEEKVVRNKDSWLYKEREEKVKKKRKFLPVCSNRETTCRLAQLPKY